MSIDKGQLNRRSFLKGLIALGTVAALPADYYRPAVRWHNRPFLLTQKPTKSSETPARVTAMTPVA